MNVFIKNKYDRLLFRHEQAQMSSLFAFLLFGMVGRAQKERLDVSVLRLGMYVSHWIVVSVTYLRASRVAAHALYVSLACRVSYY